MHTPSPHAGSGGAARYAGRVGPPDEATEDPERHAECAARIRRVRAACSDLADRPAPLWALLFPVLLVALLLASAAAAAAAWARGAPLQALGWVLVGGWCEMALAFLGHDCGHSAFSHRAAVNRHFGRWIFAVSFVSFHGFRTMHRGHHRHTGFDEDPSGDNPRLRAYDGFLVYFFFVLFPVGFPMLAVAPGWLALLGFRPEVYPPSLRPAILADLGAAVTFHGLAFLGLGPQGYLGLLASWGVGAWLISQVLSFNHVGVESYTSCVLCNSRSFRVPEPLHFFLLYGGHHIEHHLAPRVAWHRLPEVHRRLRAEGVYDPPPPGVLAVHLELLASYWRALRGRWGDRGHPGVDASA